MTNEIHPKDESDTWETCPLPVLLSRIMRLNRALLFCRGRAADIRDHVIQERDRLISIYSRRNRAINLAGK